MTLPNHTGETAISEGYTIESVHCRDTALVGMVCHTMNVPLKIGAKELTRRGTAFVLRMLHNTHPQRASEEMIVATDYPILEKARFLFVPAQYEKDQEGKFVRKSKAAVVTEQESRSSSGVDHKLGLQIFLEDFSHIAKISPTAKLLDWLGKIKQYGGDALAGLAFDLLEEQKKQELLQWGLHIRGFGGVMNTFFQRNRKKEEGQSNVSFAMDILEALKEIGITFSPDDPHMREMRMLVPVTEKFRHAVLFQTVFDHQQNVGEDYPNKHLMARLRRAVAVRRIFSGHVELPNLLEIQSRTADPIGEWCTRIRGLVEAEAAKSVQERTSYRITISV